MAIEKYFATKWIRSAKIEAFTTEYKNLLIEFENKQDLIHNNQEIQTRINNLLLEVKNNIDIINLHNSFIDEYKDMLDNSYLLFNEHEYLRILI